MKYLLINQCYSFGGTEVQTKREFHDFINRGHQVRLITLDPQLSFRESKEKGHINITHPYSEKKLDFYRFFVDKQLYKDLKKEIKAFNPDFIHLNNIFYSPISVYKAVAPYRVFQTIRDYRIVCPKNVCIHEDSTTCEGCKFENCFIKCGLSNIRKAPKIMLKMVAMKLQDRWRLKSCNRFACPSINVFK